MEYFSLWSSRTKVIGELSQLLAFAEESRQRDEAAATLIQNQYRGYRVRCSTVTPSLLR